MHPDERGRGGEAGTPASPLPATTVALPQGRLVVRAADDADLRLLAEAVRRDRSRSLAGHVVAEHEPSAGELIAVWAGRLDDPATAVLAVQVQPPTDRPTDDIHRSAVRVVGGAAVDSAGLVEVRLDPDWRHADVQAAVWDQVEGQAVRLAGSATCWVFAGDGAGRALLQARGWRQIGEHRLRPSLGRASSHDGRLLWQRWRLHG